MSYIPILWVNFTVNSPHVSSNSSERGSNSCGWNPLDDPHDLKDEIYDYDYKDCITQDSFGRTPGLWI